MHTHTILWPWFRWNYVYNKITTATSSDAGETKLEKKIFRNSVNSYVNRGAVLFSEFLLYLVALQPSFLYPSSRNLCNLPTSLLFFLWDVQYRALLSPTLAPFSLIELWHIGWGVLISPVLLPFCPDHQLSPVRPEFYNPLGSCLSSRPPRVVTRIAI